MKIASWNVLAAPWAAPVHYPKDLDPALLDRAARIERIIARVIATPMTGPDAVDVWCLQEVTAPELVALSQALYRAADANSACPHLHAENGREYWSNWLGDGVPWEANGPAIIVRSEAFEGIALSELHLDDYGNAAAMMTATHRASNSLVWCVSVHLDADAHAVRVRELRSLLTQLNDAAEQSRHAHTIIAGDFNSDTQVGEIAELLGDAGFVDAHSACGQFDPTHPYARPGDGHAALARIDHIMVRFAENTGASVRATEVHDEGVWSIETPDRRLIEHLRITGTDHLRIAATLQL